MSAALSPDAWRGKAPRLSFRNQAFVNGRCRDAACGETFGRINPAPGEVLTKVAARDAEDADRAVAAAHQAREDGRWSQRAPAEPKRVLRRFAESLHAVENDTQLKTTRINLGG